MSAQPTIGRMVHYTSLGDRDGKYPSEVQAAIVTKVLDRQRGDVALHIYNPTGQFDVAEVWHTVEPAGSDAARGKWAWPTIVHGREILGTRNAGLADDGHRRDVNDTDSDATKVRQALNVLFDNRHKRGVPETEDDVNVIRRMCLEMLGKILAEKSGAELGAGDAATARAAISRIYDEVRVRFPEAGVRLNVARLTCLQHLSEMVSMTPTDAEKSDA